MLLPHDDSGGPAVRRRFATTAGLMLLAAMTLAAAHEEGVLKLATRALVAGDSVLVKGEKFTKHSGMTLALVGASGRLTLRTVRSDSLGAFTTSVLITADAGAGAYRLVAVADDGDEVASVDVTVSASVAAADHAGMPGHDAMEMGDPSNTPLVLDRARSPLLTGSVVAGIALALGMGVTLLRRRAPGVQ